MNSKGMLFWGILIQHQNCLQKPQCIPVTGPLLSAGHNVRRWRLVSHPYFIRSQTQTRAFNTSHGVKIYRFHRPAVDPSWIPSSSYTTFIFVPRYDINNFFLSFNDFPMVNSIKNHLNPSHDR